MELHEYHKLFHKIAQLPEGVANIKQVPDELTVTLDGIRYYPVGYKHTFDRKGKELLTAILHDLKTNSITEGLLEEVQRYESPNTDNKQAKESSRAVS